MKKAIILLAVTVITVSLFVSCSAKNSGSGDISTTAITDVNGETHYYEAVTDEKGEIVTDKNGSTVYAEIVTEKDKNYVTNKSTTVFNDDTKGASLSETNKTNSADNEVTFNQPNETTTHIVQTTNTVDTTVTTTTEKTTIEKETTIQSVTDKDGWINKWY